MILSSPVTSIPGIGEATSAKLAKLGISTLFDLLYHLPFRYEDRRNVFPISQVQPGETVTIRGTITSIKNEFTRSGKFIQKAVIADPGGEMDVIWFNQMFLVRALKHRSVSLFGKVDFFGPKRALISPDYELLSSGTNPVTLHTGRLVPVYPETAGISSKLLRSKLYSLLQKIDVDDFLPETFGLLSWKTALTQVHFPDDLSAVGPARNRLAFDELVLLQLTALAHRQNWDHLKLAHPLAVDQEQVSRFLAALPFTLTGSQLTAIKEILSDMSGTKPMNRLLEGDVGSGKTIVAAVAAFVAHQNGLQSVLMAPTQILAHQHYQTLSAIFRRFGIPVSLITSAAKSVPKQTGGVIVGTHALISEKNRPLLQNSGLVTIDEQHRFGVLQRNLAGQLGLSPHILTMTATPIPRTIALTMFGDLDISALSDLPSGRLPVKTWLVPENKRVSSSRWISDQIRATGHQAIWVCPFINDSETSVTVKAAVSEFDRLQSVFPDLKLGLLHGRLKAAEKDRVISDFRDGKINILVATPVVEVGIDIPNAGLVIIEAAEHFGLAQLHQLRGRVGRSNFQSYCLLFTSDGSSPERLKALETHHSGRELAEIDLKMRGPGQLYGTAQHGFPDFKVATYENLELLALSKSAAAKIFPDLSRHRLLLDLLKEDKIALTRPN
jgi:ATP-dependent DNA helicase RecG